MLQNEATEIHCRWRSWLVKGNGSGTPSSNNPCSMTIQRVSHTTDDSGKNEQNSQSVSARCFVISQWKALAISRTVISILASYHRKEKLHQKMPEERPLRSLLVCVPPCQINTPQFSLQGAFRLCASSQYFLRASCVTLGPLSAYFFLSQMSRFDIVIYGATGFTGKWVIRQLVNSDLFADISWAIAGRSEQKLKQVLEELAKTTGDLASETKSCRQRPQWYKDHNCWHR